MSIGGKETRHAILTSGYGDPISIDIGYCSQEDVEKFMNQEKEKMTSEKNIERYLDDIQIIRKAIRDIVEFSKKVVFISRDISTLRELREKYFDLLNQVQHKIEKDVSLSDQDMEGIYSKISTIHTYMLFCIDSSMPVPLEYVIRDLEFCYSKIKTI